MPFTPEEIEKAKPYHERLEEFERDLARDLTNLLRLWEQCEHRICRRVRSCVKTATCQTKYAKNILWWKRTQFAPYVLKRYPMVQWGAPASIVHVQLEAARAAEAESKARRQARAEGKPLPRKRRRKRVPRQPLYMPRDFADGQA
jgi:hypothetical protein